MALNKKYIVEKDDFEILRWMNILERKKLKSWSHGVLGLLSEI